jgi:hypothetical protein
MSRRIVTSHVQVAATDGLELDCRPGHSAVGGWLTLAAAMDEPGVAVIDRKKEPEMPGKDRKRWTVLIYMVADDPQGGELLDRQAVQEMDQITRPALSVNTENLYVALQVDFRTLPGVWRRSIGQSTFIRPESNAADPATLYGFFDWATAECPADHYLLIFWGHSRGQFGMFGDSDPFDYTAQTPDTRGAPYCADGSKAIAPKASGCDRVQGLLHGESRDRL